MDWEGKEGGEGVVKVPVERRNSNFYAFLTARKR